MLVDLICEHIPRGSYSRGGSMCAYTQARLRFIGKSKHIVIILNDQHGKESMQC